MHEETAYRYDLRQEVIYHLGASASEENCTGTIVNLSRGGLCLCVQKPLDVGQKVTIKSEKMDINGTVVWCNAAGVHSPDAYEVGLKFIFEE